MSAPTQQPPDFDAAFWLRRAAAILAVCIAGLLAHVRGVNNDFITYDDGMYVTDNEDVRAGLTWQGLRFAFTATDGFWHPLTWLSHMLDVQLFGVNAAAHHRTAILLHLASSILLLLALLEMTGKLGPSLVIALLFAVHPMNVESVAWVAERKGTLSTLFWMLGVIAYAAYAKRPAIWRYLVLAAAFTAGLMAKPMLVTFPLVLLLLDLWPMNRLDLDQAPAVVARRFGLLFLEKLPLLGLSALASIIAVYAENYAGALPDTTVFTPWMRLSNALVSYLRYLAHIFWPAQLSVHYQHPYDTLPIWQVVVASLVLTAISTIAICFIRSRPFLFVGWFWFVGTLVPVIGIVQVSYHAMADRYAYVPAIGIYIALAWAAAGFVRAIPRTRFILAGAIAIVVPLLIYRSWNETGYWKDTETLFRHALEENPDNFVALVKVASAAYGRGAYTEAETLSRKVMKLRPRAREAPPLLGLALAKQGRHAEAIIVYQGAIVLDPANPDIYSDLGASLMQLGAFQEALRAYDAAVALEPKHLEARKNTAACYLLMGDYPAAERVLRGLLQEFPRDVDILSNLGHALARQNRLDEADVFFRRALEILPGDKQLEANLEMYR